MKRIKKIAQNSLNSIEAYALCSCVMALCSCSSCSCNANCATTHVKQSNNSMVSQSNNAATRQTSTNSVQSGANMSV